MTHIIGKKFLIILVIAAIPRLIWLDNIPYRVDGDASQIALQGLYVWENRSPLFFTGWFGYQNMIFYLQGLFLRVFDNGIVGMRLFSSVGGILSILATYLLAKEMFNQKIALLASFFLTLLPVHLVYSKLGTDISYSAFFLPFILYLLYKVTPGRSLYLILGGLTLGFSQYFYLSVRLIPIVAIFSFIVLAYRKWSLQWFFRSLIIFIVSAFLVYGPMINYYRLYPETFFARIYQVGMLQSGMRDSGGGNRLITIILNQQTIDSFLVFFKDVNPGKFHYFENRFLPVIGSIIFCLGLLVALLEYRNRSILILFLWLISGIVLGGMLTVNSPQANRYLILFPTVAIFMALGINWVGNRIKEKYRSALIATILITYSMNSAYSYWTHETVRAFQHDVNGQITSYSSRYLSKNKYNKIFFVGNSNLYYGAVPSLEFLTKKKGIDIFEHISESNINFSKSDAFVILPSRQDELVTLQRMYPNGRTTALNNSMGYLLCYVFEI